MKVCKWCNKEKPLTEFYTQNKKKADGTPYIYYHPECKECNIKNAKEWSDNNIEKARESKRKWANDNRDLVNKHTEKAKRNGKYKEWQQNNPDKIRGYNEYRRMNKSHNITELEWEECKKYFNHRCAYCGLAIEEHFKMWKGELKLIDLHKEHVNHDGSNDLSNCVPSCAFCNSSKHNFEFETWYSRYEHFNEERLNKIHTWLNTDYKKYIKDVK